MDNLPEELIINEIIPLLSLSDIFSYSRLNKRTIKQSHSVALWKSYTRYFTHHQYQKLAIDLSLHGDKYFSFFKILISFSLHKMDIYTLHRAFISFGQKHSKGVAYLLSLLSKESHPNFFFDSRLDVAVYLTDKVISVIKKIGSDHQSSLTKRKFRPDKSLLAELYKIDNGYNNRYSHGFYRRFSMFTLHLIPIIDNLNLFDYLWLFDPRTILPEEMVDIDSSQEDQHFETQWGCGFSSNEDFNLDNHPGCRYQYLSSTMTTITGSFAEALSAHGKKYQNELVHCLCIVKSKEERIEYFQYVFNFCYLETAELFETDWKSFANDIPLPFSSINDLYLLEKILPLIIEENVFLWRFRTWGLVYEPNIWIDIFTKKDDNRDIVSTLSNIYARGYTVWVKEVVKLLKRDHKLNIDTFNIIPFQEFDYTIPGYHVINVGDTII